MVQGVDENLSQDSFDEQEGEEGEGELGEEENKFDEWEGVEMARLATIREEEERWGFTQTRELEKELPPAKDWRHSLNEDELSRHFEQLDLLRGSRPTLQQSAFHYVKGDDTIEFEKLEQTLFSQDSSRKRNGRFETTMPEEDDYFSLDFNNPFKTSSQLLRTTEKRIWKENMESGADMKQSGHEIENVIEDVEGVWHLDDDGAKVASEELDMAAWLETERRTLEHLLGEEKLVRLYQVVTMIEGEEEDLETGWQEVARVVGDGGDGMVDRVIQLVMADTHFMNSE